MSLRYLSSDIENMIGYGVLALLIAGTFTLVCLGIKVLSEVFA